MKNGSKPAFPPNAGWRDAKQDGQGMSLREYVVIKLAAAWVTALSARYEMTGYTDEHAAHEANRLAEKQAEALFDVQ